MARSSHSSATPSPTVFISYARANERRVREVARRLRAWGYRVWLDQISLHAGSDWREEIRKAILDADFLILALSPSSLGSDMVEWELDLAEQAKTVIVPIVFARGKTKSNLSRRLEALHHISFGRGNERGMTALVEALGGIRNDAPSLPGERDFPAMGENARMIGELVRLLQEFSVSGGAVIMRGGEELQYFIQFLAAPSDPEVYGEAVGNENLEPPHLLNETQLRDLETAGWDPPGKDTYGNFQRRWYVNTARARALMAGDIMRTFLDVYGHLPGERLGIEVKIDD